MLIFDAYFFRKKKNTQTNTKHIHIGKEEIESGETYEVVEPLLTMVATDNEERYYADLALFSLPQRYIFAIEKYITEVNNGGHDQFYFNSSGIVWKEALQGLEAIKHAEVYDILNASVECFDKVPSMDQIERREQLEQLHGDFEDLDMRFYKIGDIEEYMTKYIKEHEEDFYFDGDI